MDNIRCAHVEGTCKKENAGGEHRPDPEANCGRDTTKSAHSRSVPQLACLNSGTVCRGGKATDLFSHKVVAKDVFVHISAAERAGLSTLNEWQVFEYEEVSNKGKTSVENLRVQR